MPPRPLSLTTPIATSLLLVGAAIVMSVQKLALTADGSYFLARVVGDETLFGPVGRIFAEAARQLPVLVLVWGGESNTATLSIAHGVGQLVLPALVWSVAIVLARRDRVVFFAVASTGALCAGSTWLFSVSENVLAVPVTILLAALLWLPTWQRGHIALACACALVLVSSYETAALVGIAFIGWATARARGVSGRAERYACAFIAMAAAASVFVAIVGASGQGPGPTHARSFLYYLVSLEPWPLYVAFAGVAVVVVGLELGLPDKAAAALAGTGALLLGIGAVTTDTTVSAAYEARSGTSAASFALLLYLWWRWTRERAGRRVTVRTAPGWITLVPVALAVVSTVLLLDASREWQRDLSAFRTAVTANTGIVTADEVVPADRDGALWDWTSIYLSLLTRRDPDDAVLVDRSPSYVPFTPREARERFPDRYSWR